MTICSSCTHPYDDHIATGECRAKVGRDECKCLRPRNEPRPVIEEGED